MIVLKELKKAAVATLVAGAVLPLPAQAAWIRFTAPAGGATVSGTLSGTSCKLDGSGGFGRVEFFLDTTALNIDTASPWNCVLDTTKFADGAHTLKAVAYDKDKNGGTTLAQVNITVKNAVTPPPPPPPPAAVRAVPTFESLGLYWKPASNPGAAGCSVRYRKAGDVDWKDGYPMWYDARNGECRGSLVHLAPDTQYEISVSGAGQTVTATAKTWSEIFPVTRVIEVGTRSTQLNITQGGTPEGYVVYTAGSIDVANAADYNIAISVPYVIIRGLTLKGARIDAIHLLEGARDLVIEDNDISEWGRFRATNAEGWQLGMNKDAGIKAYCSTGPWLERTVIQRNRIHHPRYGANSWSEGHPEGPNAVYFFDCGGNHVFRFNEIYSEWTRYFMDGYGGAENFSSKGMPNADSDLYGNIVKHVWDDAIEAEGGNANVRIWGNYMDQTATGIATTATHLGPVYLFRNVWNRSRHYSQKTLDEDGRMYMFKSGTTPSYGNGRRYVFHNTMLQAVQEGLTHPLGGGEGLSAPSSTQPMTNTVSRNNVFHIWKSWWNSIATLGGTGNDLDYDLFNGNVAAYPGAEANGILGIPLYAPGHGWSSESGGWYQLDPLSPGYDRGERLPSFNDGYLGAAPDMGAHEGGAPAMRFGVQ